MTKDVNGLRKKVTNGQNFQKSNHSEWKTWRSVITKMCHDCDATSANIHCVDRNKT